MPRSAPIAGWLAVGLAAALGCESGVAPITSPTDPPALRRASFGNPSADEPIRPIEPATGLDPAKVELGRRLFHDVRLSTDNTISCASCHDLQRGGDDGRPTSIGVGDSVGPLNAPTVLNCGLSIAQFWDGRAATLEEQVAGPVHNPVEMGSDWEEVVQKLSRDGAFRGDFERAYPGGLSGDSIADAIATFERSLVTVDAPFDRYLRGDLGAISESAVEGYELFKSVGCVSCHQGQLVGGNMFQRFGVMIDDGADRDAGPDHERGRFNVTKRDEDLFRFKVPTLRNVAQTAPYFHSGQAATLEEAIVEMAECQLGAALTDDEVRRIRDFLATLTGVLPAGSRGPAPADSPKGEGF